MTKESGPSRSFPAGFSGIDPSLMDRLILQCRRGESALAEVPSSIRRMLSGFPEVDASALQKIVQIGHWMDGQIPLLHRRRQLILASDGGKRSTAGLLPYVESRFASPAAAQRYGRELAERLKKIKHSENYHDVLQELAGSKYDPDVTAAFFSALGVERARKLPLEINTPGNSQVADVSDAFGTAVCSGGHVSGFSRVSQEISSGDLNKDDLRGLGKLLSHGSFPPDWLANVVVSQAIDPVIYPRPNTADPDERSLGDFLHALGNNPAAARLAIGVNYAMPRPRILDALSDLVPISGNPGSPTLGPGDILAQRIKLLTSAVIGDPACSKELGRAFAAASGTDDEADGKHSVEASWFAYSVMTSLSHFSTRSDYGKVGMPDEMKIYMSRIAGAYPEEIVEGANLKDRNADDASSFGKVDSAVPGLNPMFNLSPKDTYAFMKAFAESDDLEKPFKEGMGNLIGRLRTLGIQIENKRKPGDDSPGLGRIMTSLGYVAGMELAAEKNVRGNLDQQEEQSRKLLQKIVGVGSAAAGFAAPEGLAGEILWETLLFQGENSVGDALDSVGSPRVDKLAKEDSKITLASHYELVRAFIGGGYKMDVSPSEFSKNHPSIVDESGNLISFSALQKDSARLASYREWLRVNGLGGSHDRSFGQSSSDASSLFLGARQEASKNAESWDGH